MENIFLYYINQVVSVSWLVAHGPCPRMRRGPRSLGPGPRQRFFPSDDPGTVKHHPSNSNHQPKECILEIPIEFRMILCIYNFCMNLGFIARHPTSCKRPHLPQPRPPSYWALVRAPGSLHVSCLLLRSLSIFCFIT